MTKSKQSPNIQILALAPILFFACSERELDVCHPAETKKQAQNKEQVSWWTVAVWVGGDMLEEYILRTNNNILLHNV